MRSSNSLLVFFTAVATSLGAACHAANFQGVGVGTFVDMSRNGDFVLLQKPNFDVYRWSAVTGAATLAFPASIGRAMAISNDGSIIAGVSVVSGNVAFRWTAQSGAVSISDLPGGTNYSLPNAISADGSTIVGVSSSTLTGILPGREAFRWTVASGIAPLGHIPGAEPFSTAESLNFDGSVVVGYDGSANNAQAFRWTAATANVGLGDLPGGVVNAQAHYISADGNVVVGHSNVLFDEQTQDYREEAFRWTAATGMVGLGIPSDAYVTQATGVSSDGAIVVGYIRSNTNEHRAFLWDATRGMRDFQTVLTNDFGVNTSGWTLNAAIRISDDGRTISGGGINPSGQLEVWVATIPEPPTAVMALGVVAAVATRRRPIA